MKRQPIERASWTDCNAVYVHEPPLAAAQKSYGERWERVSGCFLTPSGLNKPGLEANAEPLDLSASF